MTAEQWLADLEAKAKAATPGPWANTDNVMEMFGVEPSDWWNIYAKSKGKGKGLPCIPIMQMNSNLATEEEMLQAREDHFRKGLPERDPGQSGKNARFVVAANPAAVLRLVAMVRWLAGQGDYVCPPEKFRTVDCPEVQREEFCPCKRCWAEAAYNATEAQIKKEAQ